MAKATERDRQADPREERMTLYKQGLNDTEIACRQQVHRTSVSEWRRRLNLEANQKAKEKRDPGGDTGTSKRAAKEAERLVMYDQGLSDRDIASRQSVRENTILVWRKHRGLSPNFIRGRRRDWTPEMAAITPELKRRCRSLLERGIGAQLIAREMYVPAQKVDRWRTQMLQERPELQRLGTASNRPRRFPSGGLYSKFREDRRARAFILYADGKHDREIAADLGCARTKVWQWRNALFLPPIEDARWKNGPRSKPKHRWLGPAISPMSNPLHAHIRSAVGRGLAPDIVDDAVSDIWVAVLEGELPVEHIAAQAKGFRGKTVTAYANKHRDRSLDEELGDKDGFRMIDMIRDDRSSSWLEEMGATVW